MTRYFFVCRSSEIVVECGPVDADENVATHSLMALMVCRIVKEDFFDWTALVQDLGIADAIQTFLKLFNIFQVSLCALIDLES